MANLERHPTRTAEIDAVLPDGYELVRGRGYLYFVATNEEAAKVLAGVEESSVLVPRVRDLTIRAWLEAFEEKIGPATAPAELRPLEMLRCVRAELIERGHEEGRPGKHVAMPGDVDPEWVTDLLGGVDRRAAVGICNAWHRLGLTWADGRYAHEIHEELVETVEASARRHRAERIEVDVRNAVWRLSNKHGKVEATSERVRRDVGHLLNGYQQLAAEMAGTDPRNDKLEEYADAVKAGGVAIKALEEAMHRLDRATNNAIYDAYQSGEIRTRAEGVAKCSSSQS